MRMLHRAAGALVPGPDSEEPVIVVDDAHLLDDVSASLLQQLVAQRRATVILTVRSAVPAPDAIESVWKDGYLDRIEVLELSFEEIAGLLAAALDGPVERDSARRLYAVSGGNALFLRHIVAGELGAGHLVEQSGLWRWLGGLTVSPELVELVAHRLDGLPEGCSELLDMLALAGPLELCAVERLVSPEPIEEAESAGVVAVGHQLQRPVVRLSHPLYAEVRLAALGVLRARRIRGAIARELAQVDDPSPAFTLRRAVLSLDSNLAPDAELLTAGAQAALGLLDWDLGRRLATAAVEAGGGFEASLALSYALGFSVDPPAADRLLEELEETAPDNLQRLQATVPRAGHMYYVQGRTDEAVQLLEDARAALGDPTVQPLVDGIRAMFAAMSSEAEVSLRLADDALAGGPLPPLLDLCAHWARVVTLSAIGRTDQLGEAEERTHETAAGSYESCLPRLGYGELHVRALRLAGRILDAADLADKFRPDIRDAGTLTLMAESIAGHADLARGRVTSAREVVSRCIDGLLGHETSGWTYTSAITLTMACAMAGDGPAARAAAELMERERHPGFTTYELDRLLAWAWVDAADGSTSSAIRQARHAADLAAEDAQWGYEAYALATSVRFGDATVADRLVELDAIVDGPRIAAAARQALALAGSDATGLLEASQAFEEMGDLLSAADAAAQAAGCHATQGSRAAHQAAYSRACRLQAECEGALTPALAATQHPLPLTDREREIVTLAASGLSNKEIADRLVVSVRTVEGHLYRAGAKLGTTDRRRFPAVLRGY
jgi:DNA-binding NarL/FixJ family response regulator/tetratricopeptide (TPR) repeat protein